MQYGEQGRERRDRAWARAKHAIDRAQEDPSGRSTVQTTREVIQGARPEEIGVLVQEVPADLESLGLPTDFVESEVAAKAPKLAEAQRELTSATRDVTVLRHTIAAVKRGIDSSSPVPEVALVDPAAVARRVGDVGKTP